mmetsp:Transcript_9645/g.15313  ORF Transcript_9645/g.15313 Transcript_9645/m.15313 type:complete len:211 (+) Transcript_9645:1-633(+)
MRLDQPDDQLGAAMLLSIPSMVVHRIDGWSPLAPQADSSERSPEVLGGGSRHMAWPLPRQRQADCETGSRHSCVCPTCGETFATVSVLQLHCRYNAATDKSNGYPPEVCHQELDESQLSRLTHKEPTRDEICEHLASRYREVIVLVEGIEPTTSATLQARHSYVVGRPGHGDTVWDMEFEDCLLIPKDAQAGLGVDLGRFHAIQNLGPGV